MIGAVIKSTTRGFGSCSDGPSGRDLFNRLRLECRCGVLRRAYSVEMASSTFSFAARRAGGIAAKMPARTASTR